MVHKCAVCLVCKTMNFEAAALAYVRHVMAELRLAPTALAAKAGLSSTTLTRALNDPNHKFTLSTKTLERIAAASGISPAPFLLATSSVEVASLPFRSDELSYGDDGPKTTELWPQDVIYVGGEIALGKWRELGPFEPVGDYEPLLLNYPIYSPGDVFACVVLDESANKIAAKGEMLVCVRPKAAIAAMPQNWAVNNMPVVVERRSTKDFKVELTVRLLRFGRGDNRTLLAANKGKPLAPPLNYVSGDEPLNPDPGFRIVGFVQYVVRKVGDC
jgi:transcriptional regulator with XRE-family HTH domain